MRIVSLTRFSVCPNANNTCDASGRPEEQADPDDTKIGVPYYVFDFEQTFRREVIDKFVNSYAAGVTPNPCVDCNNKVKFKELRERSRAMGVRKLATGHYAQVMNVNGRYSLARGTDSAKDQSYFLYGLKPQELHDTLFPVGALSKPQVRELAKKAGLTTHDKAESQDICFVSGSVSDFLVKLGKKRNPGVIVKKDGTVLGQHDGIQNFTVGQRRGVGVGGSEKPLYVLELDISSNRVIVGERSELERAGFSVYECNWIEPVEQSFDAIAQLRHRHEGVKVQVEIEGSSAKVRFVDQFAVVSPGQACVFYNLNNQIVLGGGVINRDT